MGEKQSRPIFSQFLIDLGISGYIDRTLLSIDDELLDSSCVCMSNFNNFHITTTSSTRTNTCILSSLMTTQGKRKGLFSGMYLS